MPDERTISVTGESMRSDVVDDAATLGLVILWSASEPARVGEVALFADAKSHTLGRGDGAGSGERRARFVRQRPGRNEPRPPLGGLGLSREQLRITISDEGLDLESIGRKAMTRGGVERARCRVVPGDVVTLRGQLVLQCVRRPATIAPSRLFPTDAWGVFGGADRFGMIGESPAAWSIRERIAFVAKADAHALLVGPSGTGKELAARAIHALSSRASKPIVARNAATIPAGIIDAELFGNAKNYPNAGMAERTGIIGDAAGGTLFLDEIGELGHELQAHLLRVLDAGGEYQRLGESGTRRSDFRLVAATNRSASSLKPDFVARLRLRADLPSLADRREDIPLLASRIVLSAAASSPEVAERFVADIDGVVTARIDAALIEHLATRDLPLNVRDVDALLWRAMSESAGTVVAMNDALRDDAPPDESERGVSADDVTTALARANGNITRAAKSLGLPSRFALYRLMRRFGVERPAGDDD